MINIRKALTTDLKALSQIYTSQLTFHNNIEEIWNKSWFNTSEGTNWLADYIDREDKVVYLSTHDEQIVGYLQAEVRFFGMKKSDPTAILTSIHVIDNYRCQGIGSELVKMFFTFAKNNKARRAEVGVVYNNPEAIKFYKKYGFGDFLLTLSKDIS